MKRKRKKIDVFKKHKQYPIGKIKLGSIRILFRSTYIRFIQQCDNGQYSWCQPR